jgi:hypothetical protein
MQILKGILILVLSILIISGTAGIGIIKHFCNFCNINDIKIYNQNKSCNNDISYKNEVNKQVNCCSVSSESHKNCYENKTIEITERVYEKCCNEITYILKTSEFIGFVTNNFLDNSYKVVEFKIFDIIKTIKEDSKITQIIYPPPDKPFSYLFINNCNLLL